MHKKTNTIQSRLIADTILLISILLVLAVPALAQEAEELNLSFSRDFGYSSGSGDIQGTFSMKASGPENLAQVTFYIDDQAIGTDSEAPFKIQFTTDSYPLGTHSMHAEGTTTDGRTLKSKVATSRFVSAEEGWKAALGIAGPILGLVLVVSVISILGPLLTGKKKGSVPLGASRNYGMAGGAICPKCGRPFARNFLAPNMVMGKLDRCPHCGKWSIVRARSQAELKAAEEAELKMAAGGPQVAGETPEEKLRKELDDSRFHDV